MFTYFLWKLIDLIISVKTGQRPAVSIDTSRSTEDMRQKVFNNLYPLIYIVFCKYDFQVLLILHSVFFLHSINIQ